MTRRGAHHERGEAWRSREDIWALSREGLSVERISQIVGLSRSTVVHQLREKRRELGEHDGT